MRTKSLMGFLHPEIASRLMFFFYRHRFLIVYVIFGFLSLCLEAVMFRGLEKMGCPTWGALTVGLIAGIYFAYWMNVRFNFKVPTAKRNRALLYFCAISAGSGILNFLLSKPLKQMGLTYTQARFATSGLIFFIAYLFHRRFSFADFKKVGVAIYANGIEDIKGIHDKIGAYPDFIHVDVIDHTFGEKENDPKAYRLEVIQAYWPRKPIHIHIMSKHPSRWVEETSPFVSTIYVHIEIDENLPDVLNLIRSKGKRAGICITMATAPETLKPFLPQLDTIMLLTIPVVGKSGQAFDMDALARIEEINGWPERSHFTLCVDGGVNERNVRLLNVESVVSGSSVLNNTEPARQIMRLQTSSNYERI